MISCDLKENDGSYNFEQIMQNILSDGGPDSDKIKKAIDKLKTKTERVNEFLINLYSKGEFIFHNFTKEFLAMHLSSDSIDSIDKLSRKYQKDPRDPITYTPLTPSLFSIDGTRRIVYRPDVELQKMDLVGIDGKMWRVTRAGSKWLHVDCINKSRPFYECNQIRNEDLEKNIKFVYRRPGANAAASGGAGNAAAASGGAGNAAAASGGAGGAAATASGGAGGSAIGGRRKKRRTERKNRRNRNRSRSNRRF